MATWRKQSLKLEPHHLWNAKPGYKIFVADRGAVRFDIPDTWVIVPEETTIKFHDKTPPDDDCTLQLTVIRLPPIDWSGLPLSRLVTEVTKDDSREIQARGDVVEARRGGIELAWMWVRFRDPNENREAFSRICLARKPPIQVLLTFDYWADDASRLTPAWDEILRSMQLAQSIGDPTLGDTGRG